MERNPLRNGRESSTGRSSGGDLVVWPERSRIPIVSTRPSTERAATFPATGGDIEEGTTEGKEDEARACPHNPHDQSSNRFDSHARGGSMPVGLSLISAAAMLRLAEADGTTLRVDGARKATRRGRDRGTRGEGIRHESRVRACVVRRKRSCGKEGNSSPAEANSSHEEESSSDHDESYRREGTPIVRPTVVPSDVEEWLLATYAPDPQSSVMKSKAYGNYERFCEDQDKTPAHMLVFSKYLIALFPKLKSRRLGPRGKGVPHYGGIRKRRENR